MNAAPLCSIVIPAFREAENLGGTITKIGECLEKHQIPFEVLVVNDAPASGDPATEKVMNELHARFPGVRLVNNPPENHGFGRAIALGLSSFRGDCVALMMADGSDEPEDLAKYYRKFLEGYDCVFGSRFVEGGEVVDYPSNKLFVNRLSNWFLSILFFTRYSDFTNAFKLYSRPTIQGLQPFIAPHFNITVELSLKALARGYRWTVVPNRWYGRKTLVSNLRIAKMGTRYLYIALVIFLERLLVRADYAKKGGT